MKEHPILFSAPMVRAILDGPKTQTRRVVKGIPSDAEEVFWWAPEGGIARPGWADPGVYYRNPRGLHCIHPSWHVGDKLWVRETWCHKADDNGMIVYNAEGNWDASCVWYAADGIDVRAIDADGWGETNNDGTERSPWRPSIHMPRWASRITLEVTGVRAERVGDISEADARAEGITDGGCLNCGESEPCGCASPEPSARDSFAWLWQNINGEYSWHANPWVWVIEFKREVTR